MIIFLVLGLFASLYMLWLLFALAAQALPFYAGISVAFLLHHLGCGYVASIVVGFIAGAFTLGLGQALFVQSRSTSVRCAIAVLFIAPAAIAGYSATHGVVGHVIGNGVFATLVGLVGALGIANTAWRHLASGPIAPRI